MKKIFNKMVKVYNVEFEDEAIVCVNPEEVLDTILIHDEINEEDLEEMEFDKNLFLKEITNLEINEGIEILDDINIWCEEISREELNGLNNEVI